MKKFKCFLLIIFLIILLFALGAMTVLAADGAPTEPAFEVKYEVKISVDKSTLLFSEEPVEILTDPEYFNGKAYVFPLNTRVANKLDGELVQIYISSESMARTGKNIKFTGDMYELVLGKEVAGDKNGVRILSANMGRGLLNVMVSGGELPAFTVKAEVPIWDGTVLLFSEKPVRAQWSIGEYPYDVAFVFPQGTKIAHKFEDVWKLIYAVSEYDALKWISTMYSRADLELALSEEMGVEKYGVRIISTGSYGHGLLPILIDGVSEYAVNPGDSLIYAREMEAYNTKAADEKSLAYLRQPSRGIQSDDPDIIALSETITAGISSDYQKARAIHKWVANNIWYDNDWMKTPSLSEKMEMQYSTAVLRNKRGTCGGYSNLTAALLRAAGIPAKVITGLSGNSHAWNEAFVDGQWINMDVQGDNNNYYQNGEYSPQQPAGNKCFDVPNAEFAKNHTVYNYADYILKNQLAIIEPEPEPETAGSPSDDINTTATAEAKDNANAVSSNTIIIIIAVIAALVIAGVVVFVVVKKKK